MTIRRRMGAVGDLFDPLQGGTPVNVLQQAAEDAAGYARADQSQRTFTYTNPAPATALSSSQLDMPNIDLSTLAMTQDVAPIIVSFDWKKALAIGGGIALLIYGLAHLRHSR